MDVVKNIHSINPHSQKIVFVLGNNVNPDAAAFALSTYSCADPEGQAGGPDHPSEKLQKYRVS